MRNNPRRHYWYFFFAFAFVFGACRYAEFLGRATAQNIGSVDQKTYVSLYFRDSALQAEFGSSKFTPLLIVGEDLFLVQTTPRHNDVPDDNSRRRIVVVKKDLVQMLALHTLGN
jgi:hypothetical protein